MTLPAILTRPPVPTLRAFGWRSVAGVRRHVPSHFALLTGLYLLVATLLVFRGGFIVGDAWSRVGNAAWMITSRDPHLAAIGFVWNPLPSLVILPLVAIRGLWDPLVSTGFAANLSSALFMAGAVVVLARIALDLRVRPVVAAIIVGLFALHPMIVLYGANGMSEAPFVFLLLLTIRSLMAWWRTGSTSSLVMTGIALGLAYLTRYEAIAAAAGVLVVVGLRTFLRFRAREERWRWVAAESLIAGLPFAFAFAGWAVASWIITGNPFETFTSIYGNSSQVSLAGTSIADTTGHGLDALRYAIGQILGLAPTLPILLALVGVLAYRRGQLEAIVPVAVLGSVLAFGMLTTVTGSSFAWLRFSIYSIPLAAILAFLALARRPVAEEDPKAATASSIATIASAAPSRSRPSLPASTAPAAIHTADAGTTTQSPALRAAAARTIAGVARSARSAGGRAGRIAGRALVDGLASATKAPPSEALLTLALIALVAVSLPIGLGTMTNPHMGREEVDQLRAIGNGHDPTLASVQQAEIGGQAAAYIDGMNLPDGSVVVDVAVGFQIVLQSKDPHQFVITPDRDFARVLADPKTFHATYLLLPSGVGYSSLDAVSRAYPGLFRDGGRFVTLVREWGSGIFAWRLYSIN
jgi:hypothetical protein